MRNRLLKSFALVALLATVFTSCTKDDDDNNDNGNNDDTVVDLGLQSGVKWTKMNVGAVNPWDYGNYYAWGETETKDDYSWETYKYCAGSYQTYTKYCYDAYYGIGGFTDTLTILEATDDVATAVLGSDYSMPTLADWEDLRFLCYWVWTENYNNQNASGYIVYKAKSVGDRGAIVFSDGKPSRSYSLKDAHIFLPAAGYRIGSSIEDAGSGGYYWSTSVFEGNQDDGRCCIFNSSYGSPEGAFQRTNGISVRPVRRK